MRKPRFWSSEWTETRLGQVLMLAALAMDLLAGVRRGAREWHNLDGLERAHNVVRTTGTALAIAIAVRKVVRKLRQERELPSP